MKTNRRKALMLGILLAAQSLAPAGLTQSAKAATPAKPMSQVTIPPQQKLMAKRAAELDAYRQLAERIMGLKVDANSTVRDMVTDSDRVATSLDQMIKGVRFGAIREYEDGSCEVDAEVTLQQIVKTLSRAIEEVQENGHWTKRHVENITRTTVRKVIAVTGAGAVRPQTMVPTPKTQDIVKSASPSRRRAALNLPDIYKQHPAAYRLRAKRAAELDGYRKLVERIYGLQVSGTSKLRDMVNESDEVRTRAQAFLKGARITSVRYCEDGVVEVEMQVTLQEVITSVQRAYEESGKFGQTKRDEVEKIRRYTTRKVITVLGTGALDVQSRGSQATAPRKIIGSTIEETIILD